jgi:uncharacterized protein
MSEREIACPRCGRPTLYGPSNPDRPFCSARCKTIDLGDWAQERYRIRLALPDDDDEGPYGVAGGPDPEA